MDMLAQVDNAVRNTDGAVRLTVTVARDVNHHLVATMDRQYQHLLQLLLRRRRHLLPSALCFE
jgi:hypothetical protein